MNISVREATLDDIEALLETRLEVLKVVFELPEDADMSVLEQTNRLYYEHAIPAGEHIACLVYVDGALAGCGGACINRQMPSPECANGLSAYLMNIYTRPTFRGKGIGSSIVEWLVEQCWQHEVSRINLQATADGRGIYEKCGFTAMNDFMELLPH